MTMFSFFLPALTNNSTLFQLGKKETSFLSKAQKHVYWLEGRRGTFS